VTCRAVASLSLSHFGTNEMMSAYQTKKDDIRDL
jgi:hypothetical protein